jgi:hypothetical protein
MAIEKFKKLAFSKTENEDEYFEYTDDPDFEEVQPRGGRRLFAFSFYGALLGLGVTFGANIVILEAELVSNSAKAYLKLLIVRALSI